MCVCVCERERRISKKEEKGLKEELPPKVLKGDLFIGMSCRVSLQNEKKIFERKKNLREKNNNQPLYF